MRLGKGRGWPGLVTTNTEAIRGESPPRCRSGILGRRPNPLLLPRKLHLLSEQEAARCAQRRGALGDAPVYLGSLHLSSGRGKGLGRRRGERAGAFVELRSACLRDSLGPGSQGGKKTPTPGVKPCLRNGSTSAGARPRARVPPAPAHPRGTAPLVLVSRLVNYSINGLQRQANPHPALTGQFCGQARAAVCLPASGQDLFLG